MMRFWQYFKLPELEGVTISSDGEHCELLEEGKWIRGRFDSNIRIDQPTHGVGQTHAHVLGRRGEAIGVVNMDGSASHGTRAKLHRKDADALRERGFKIKAGNVVEWTELPAQPKLIRG